MANIGKWNTLTVIKEVDFGIYLDAEQLGEILLPKKQVPEHIQIEDNLDVFLYLDSEDRPIATRQKPKIQVGQFAYLKCIQTGRVGAFLDWGLEKDILVPFAEQHRPMEEGKSYLVHAYIDHVDQRITASSKIDRFLEDENQDTFKVNQKVDLIIGQSTELGFKAIINHSHWGVLFKNEVFQRLSFGQSKQGFIKHIRPDGRIDLSLQSGQETRDKYSNIVMAALEKEGGFIGLHDKSDPKLISSFFGMSKAAYKKAIGGLYKQGLIKLDKTGITLIEPDN